MKLLGICGSARRGGASEKVLDALLMDAASSGWETETFFASGTDLNGCSGCFACEKTGRCVQDGDAVSGFFSEVLPGSDFVLLVSPVYFMGVPWALKRVIDRAQLHYARRMRSGGKYPENGASGIVILSGTAPRKHLGGPRLVLRSFLKETGYPCKFEGWLDALETSEQPFEKRLGELRETFSEFLAGPAPAEQHSGGRT